MLDIQRALRDDRLNRALTGLNRSRFETLLLKFTEVYEQSLRVSSKPRQRAVGGGRKARLRNLEDKLFFILFYFKCYPTFDVAGILFDLNRSQTHYWMHRLQPLLEATLGQELALPERKIETVEAFVQRFPKVKAVIIDGTERPIQHPQDDERQRLNYSGKKRRHTRKHLAMVATDKRVLVLSHAREGKVHDKRLLDETEFVAGVPDEVPIAVDLGFQGLQNQFVNIEIGHKKPKGGELTDEQKKHNQQHNRVRVKCEHAFAGIKRYNAITHAYRNRVSNFDDRLMLTTAGLWNFYLMSA